MLETHGQDPILAILFTKNISLGLVIRYVFEYSKFDIDIGDVHTYTSLYIQICVYIYIIIIIYYMILYVCVSVRKCTYKRINTHG